MSGNRCRKSSGTGVGSAPTAAQLPMRWFARAASPPMANRFAPGPRRAARTLLRSSSSVRRCTPPERPSWSIAALSAVVSVRALPRGRPGPPGYTAAVRRAITASCSRKLLAPSSVSTRSAASTARLRRPCATDRSAGRTSSDNDPRFAPRRGRPDPAWSIGCSGVARPPVPRPAPATPRTRRGAPVPSLTHHAPTTVSHPIPPIVRARLPVARGTVPNPPGQRAASDVADDLVQPVPVSAPRSALCVSDFQGPTRGRRGCRRPLTAIWSCVALARVSRRSATRAAVHRVEVGMCSAVYDHR